MKNKVLLICISASVIAMNSVYAMAETPPKESIQAAEEKAEKSKKAAKAASEKSAADAKIVEDLKAKAEIELSKKNAIEARQEADRLAKEAINARQIAERAKDTATNDDIRASKSEALNASDAAALRKTANESMKKMAPAEIAAQNAENKAIAYEKIATDLETKMATDLTKQAAATAKETADISAAKADAAKKLAEAAVKAAEETVKSTKQIKSNLADQVTANQAIEDFQKMQFMIGLQASTYMNETATPNTTNHAWEYEGAFVGFDKNWGSESFHFNTAATFGKANVQQGTQNMLEIIRGAQVIDAKGYLINEIDNEKDDDILTNRHLRWLIRKDDNDNTSLYSKLGVGFMIPTSSQVTHDFLGNLFGGYGIKSKNFVLDKSEYHVEIGVGYDERFQESLRLGQGELGARFPQDQNGAWIFNVGWSPDMTNGPDDFKVMFGMERNVQDLFSNVTKIFPNSPAAAAAAPTK